MKIFISHKKEDEREAKKIRDKIISYGEDAYLDVLDDEVCETGEKLTRHIKNELHACTDIIVVLSQNTKKSWWVPFEIGMASAKDMPIANFLISSEPLPEYLEYWPRLKELDDIRKYIQTRNRVILEQYVGEKTMDMQYRVDSSMMSLTEKFYKELKKVL